MHPHKCHIESSGCVCAIDAFQLTAMGLLQEDAWEHLCIPMWVNVALNRCMVRYTPSKRDLRGQAKDATPKKGAKSHRQCWSLQEKKVRLKFNLSLVKLFL